MVSHSARYRLGGASLRRMRIRKEHTMDIREHILLMQAVRRWRKLAFLSVPFSAAGWLLAAFFWLR